MPESMTMDLKQTEQRRRAEALRANLRRRKDAGRSAVEKEDAERGPRSAADGESKR